MVFLLLQMPKFHSSLLFYYNCAFTETLLHKCGGNSKIEEYIFHMSHYTH